MNLENVRYDAFISYRHCELDKFVAENLHKQLEAFKVPKSLIAAGKTNKTKISRVFRDRDELPLASNLADPITTALSQSDFLIVICSPRLPQSKWCLREIETFIEMHGREHVLAVLIEGEPEDSFPDILRYEECTVTDENGNTHIEKMDVEPLAADVRGANKKEVLKAIKSELLRLMAPILDCNYDDLKMRHKEARQKKILRISLSISFVCFLFATISTTMALTIRKQAATIQEQYTESLKTQAVSYAAMSKSLLDEEDRMAALSVTRMVSPDNLKNQGDKPYTTAAEYALSNSLGIYNNGHYNYPAKTLEQNSPIKSMIVSPNEETITTVDTNSQITIFNVGDASVIASFTLPEEHSKELDKEAVQYLNDETLVYLAYGGFYIYDIPSKKETFVELEYSCSKVACSSDGKYIAMTGYDGVQIFEADGSFLYSYSFPENYQNETALKFNADKQLLSFSAISLADDARKTLVGLIDLNKKEVLYTKELSATSIEQLVFIGDQLLVGGNIINQFSDNMLDIRLDTYITSLNASTGETNWEYTKTAESFQFLTGSLAWESKTIAYAGNHGVTFVNSADGSFISSQNINGNVIEVVPLATDGYVFAITEEGEKILTGSDNATGTMTMEVFDTSKGDFSEFNMCQNFDAAYRRNATAITIYQKLKSDKAETFASFEDYITNILYSAKQNSLIYKNAQEEVCVKQGDEIKKLSLSDTDEYLTDIVFTNMDEKEFALVYDSFIDVYNTCDGEKVKTVSLPEVYAESIDAKGVSETLTTFAIADTAKNSLVLYEVKTGKQLTKCEINASTVRQLMVSEQANCVIVTYLDDSVALYSMDDLSVVRTFTDFTSSMKYFGPINVKTQKRFCRSCLCFIQFLRLLSFDKGL